jgi:hypothetical protein
MADRMPPMRVYTSGIAVDTIAAIHQSTVLYSSLQKAEARETTVPSTPSATYIHQDVAAKSN